jgi:hypothetical protein
LVVFLTERQLKATVHQQRMSCGALGPNNLAISHHEFRLQRQPLSCALLKRTASIRKKDLSQYMGHALT